MNPEDLKKESDQALRRQEIDALDPIGYEQLQQTIQKWMIVEDPGIIKLPIILLLSLKLPGKPVWSFIVGPSGGGKTEFLQGVSELPETHVISSITPNTLLSGMPGKSDMSLLPRVDRKTLLFFDWTNISSQPRDARMAILGQLRDSYDGHVKKEFGNGKVAEWGPGGKIGIIAAVTQIVDMQQQMSTSLGERFLYYRIKMPDRLTVARRALDNTTSKDQMEKEIANAYISFRKGISIPEELPVLPDDFKDELVQISEFVTRARSGVIRDYGPQKEVIFVPSPEMPTRIVQQLGKVALSAMVVNGEDKLHDVDKKIIEKYAFDSVPLANMMAIKQMAREDRLTTKDIATAMGYPTAPVRMYLENLSMLGVCDRISGKETSEGGTADRWELKSHFKKLIHTHFSDELIQLDADFDRMKEELDPFDDLSDDPSENLSEEEEAMLQEWEKD